MNPDPRLLLSITLILLATLGLLFWPGNGLLTRWQRTLRRSRRVLMEDALKQIHKTYRNGQVPTLEGIAGGLGIPINQAAGILADLEAGELIAFKGADFSLTSAGEEYAIRIIRAHRIWERYLADKTGFSESEWHAQADRIEHDISENQVKQLSANLGNPTHDPHGDPIPSQQGDWKGHGGRPLSEISTGTLAKIVHLEDEPAIIYEQLLAEGLFPGMIVQIAESNPQRVRFWTNGEDHVLSPIHARNISALPLSTDETTLPQGTPLDALGLGDQGRVIGLSPAIRGMERRRLLDLGVLPGTVITTELRSPGNDPTAYRVRGALIALRAQQARHIKVEKIHEG